MPNAERPIAPQAESFRVNSPEGGPPSAPPEALDACRQRMTSFVDEQPLTAVMTLFGVGLGAGLLIAGLLTPPESRSRTQQVSDRIYRAVHDALPGSLR